MARLRTLAPQAPAIMISLLALAFSLGGGAYAATHSPAAHARASSRSVHFHNLALLNGWVSSQSVYGTGDPRVALRAGIVYLAGSMHQASGTNQLFATLPAKYRPRHDLWLPIYTLDGTEGSLEIAASGAMYAFAGSATGYSSLAGISYPVNS